MKRQLIPGLINLIQMLALLAGLAACMAASSSRPELTPVTVQLRWTHQAQFAGFYAADQNGYYADEGLAVTFLEGGPFVDRLTPVLEGEAQFGVASGLELIVARAQGKPVKAIATILRRDPFAFFALADSGITRPEDFVGKTIQIRERSRPFLRTMMNNVGISPDQYIENYEADFGDLYTGEIDVAVGFMTAQLIEAEKAGYKINVIYPDDYGVHFYTDVIFTTDEVIEANPELVRRFLQATIKGWVYAIENASQAGELVAHYKAQVDVLLENEKMFASLPLINTGRDHIGWMIPEVWQGMVDTLVEQEVITSSIQAKEVYTIRFLEEVYDQ